MVVGFSLEPNVGAARRQRQDAAEAEWSAVYQQKASLSPAVADIAAAILRNALQRAAAYSVERPDVNAQEGIDICPEITSRAQSPGVASARWIT